MGVDEGWRGEDEVSRAAGLAWGLVPDDYSELVLEVAARIPEARVLTYGDIADVVGRGGPRGVGKVMSRWGSHVPWWRVLRAGGLPPRGHEQAAGEAWRAEGTPLLPGRPVADPRVDLRLARWVPEPGVLDDIRAGGNGLSDPRG